MKFLKGALHGRDWFKSLKIYRPNEGNISVTPAQRSNMGFLGNIFVIITENGFLFLPAWRI